MSENWLFLRGFWDNNNQRSFSDNSDMWLQLFDELVEEPINSLDCSGAICYYGYKQNVLTTTSNCVVIGQDKAKQPYRGFLFN